MDKQQVEEIQQPKQHPEQKQPSHQQQLKPQDPPSNHQTDTTPPEIPKKQYKYESKIDWGLDKFNPRESISQLKIDEGKKKEKINLHNNIAIKVDGEEHRGGILDRHIVYRIVINDKKGYDEVWRRYNEFLLLREKIVVRWPGILIPPIPKTSKVGNTESETILMRKKFLNNFLSKITMNLAIYEGEEFQAFLRKPQDEVVGALSGLKQLKFDQLLQKYKECFPQIYNQSQKDLPEQEKLKEWVRIQKFSTDFLSHQLDLNNYKDKMKKLTESKNQVLQSNSKSKSSFVALILKGKEEIKVQAPKKVEKKQEKKEENLEKKEENLEKKETEGEDQSKPKEQGENQGENGKKSEDGDQVRPRHTSNQKEIPQKVQSNPQLEVEQPEFGIMNTTAYRNKFNQTAEEIAHFNSPIWNFYDLLKFELKQSECIVQCIQQGKSIRRELTYINSSIIVNKEQIQALNQNKTTLKTFLMGGTQDDKKSKLANQSKLLEDRLQAAEELYNFVRCLIGKTIQKFHSERANGYKELIRTALNEEIIIAKKLMEFHLYQLELLDKEGKAKESKELKQASEGAKDNHNHENNHNQ